MNIDTRSKYLAVYSLTFILLSCIVFMPFIYYGHSFVWQSDGLTQHVKALTYYSMWLRSAAEGIIAGQGVPQFSFALGYGADILGTLNYYVMGDPLNLVSAFVPEAGIPYLYTALVVVRIYLAGLAFSLYVNYTLKPVRMGLLMGALVYAFCGFTIYAVVRHPYFGNPLIYFPLVLFGVEKVLREGKHLVFALAICLCMISNFYFFYMIFVLMAIYIIVRLAFRQHQNHSGFTQTAKDFGRLVASGLVGVLLSAVIFLPVTLYFMQDLRSAVDHVVPLHYSRDYYKALLFGFSTHISIGFWTRISLGIIGVLAALSLFFERKTNTQVKVLLLICVVLLCIPFAGHALNGFSYVANRWGWAFCLAGAAVVALRWDALTKLSGKQAIILCALTAVYVAACFLLNDDKALRFWYGVIALFWFVVTLIVALASYAHYHSPTKVHRTFAHATLCAVACAGIILNAYVVYLPAGGNYISLYLEQKELDSIYDTEAHAIDALGDQDFFRYSGTVTLATRNAGALTGISSTSSYWSLTNASMTVFLKELGVDGSDNAAACRYNLNGQSMLNELLGVKYYVTTPKGALPYAYKHVPLESKVLYTPQNNNEHKYGIYENTKPLPFGFTYQETVSKASYDELSPEEKREMVLQASTVVKDGADAVADTDTDNALPNTNNTNNLRFSCYDVPFVIDELEGQEGLSVENGVVKTGKGAQTVTLRVDGKKNVETTVQFTNLVLESKSTTEASIALTYHFSDGSTQKGRISIYSPRDSFYEPWPWKIYCPGFVESPLESIEIEFPTKCTYTWDKLQLIAQPMDSYDSYVDALTEDTLENLDFHYFSGDIAASNCITGDVSLDQAKVLCTQIPYSKGWSLRVDGTETDVLQVNTMLCGVMLEPGEHVIEFRYQTPGLVAGCVLSLLGLCAFVVLAFLQRRASGKAHGKHSA